MSKVSQPSACLISKSVTSGLGKQKRASQILADVKAVKVKGNEILKEILVKMPKEAKPEEKFTVLVDGSRYGIEVRAVTKEKTILHQHFLHNTGTKLVSVNYRTVVIKW